MTRVRTEFTNEYTSGSFRLYFGMLAPGVEATQPVSMARVPKDVGLPLVFFCGLLNAIPC